jgi:hypothetical protein
VPGGVKPWARQYLDDVRSLVLAALAGLAAAAGILLADAAAPPGAMTALRSWTLAARVRADGARAAAGPPALLAAPPAGDGAGVTRPWHVGIQVGHLLIAQLPEEQRRLRADTGTRWGAVPEVDVNRRIAELAAAELRRAGVRVDVLPAAVPAGYTADAFVAVHADDGGGRRVSGWKVAAPRRISAASRLLRDAIARAYGPQTGLPEDRYGVTFNMRGYYAFSWYRYGAAIAPWTPAAIIETGYLTSADDRAVIVDDPARAARGIALGILSYLAQRPRLSPQALVPRAYPSMVVASPQAPLRFFAGDDERVVARLPAGTLVRPSDSAAGWVELTVQGDFRLSGWMRLDDLETSGG